MSSPRSPVTPVATKSTVTAVDDGARGRLRDWFAAQMPGATEVEVGGLDVVTFGHSAETLRLTLTWREAGVSRARDVVLRVRPEPPGLLEPYDLRRQFDVLRALEPTPVRAPRVLWHEGTAEVLGRELYVMERVDGTVYERGVPEELERDPARIRRMCEGVVDQIAAIHTVDLHAAGLTFLGDGHDFVGRQLDHWEAQMREVQRGALPALERLLAEVRARRPDPSPLVTLVHGDPKPGNFAFVGAEVSAVFDWELTTAGDPLADVGWAEMNWLSPGAFTARPGALTPDELVARYEDLTGIPVRHREWYRAFQGFKMCVILLVAAMRFEAGHSDDLRFADLGRAVHPYTVKSLAQLGIDDDLEPGPVTASEARVRAVQERTRGATAPGGA